MATTVKLSDHSLIAQSEGAIASQVDGEAVILDIESGYFFQLNRPGSHIWWAIETQSTLAAVCERLQDTFDVAPETCRDEAVEFLNILHEKGLVTVS